MAAEGYHMVELQLELESAQPEDAMSISNPHPRGLGALERKEAST